MRGIAWRGPLRHPNWLRSALGHWRRFCHVAKCPLREQFRTHCPSVMSTGRNPKGFIVQVAAKTWRQLRKTAKRPQAKRMQLSQGKVRLAPVHRYNRHISRLGASCLCLCLREGDDAKMTEVRSLTLYHDRQMAVLRRQRRMEWSFCVGWCAKTQKPRFPALAAKKMIQRCVSGPIFLQSYT
jgi:hypothetical protein